MKLFNLKKGDKIYADLSDKSRYLVFDHMDGMYSYCKSEKGTVIHLFSGTPLKQENDGYVIGESRLKKIASLGGKTTKKRYGKEHYKKIGQKGYEKAKEKLGEDYFTKVLPQKAKEARERKKLESKSSSL